MKRLVATWFLLSLCMCSPLFATDLESLFKNQNYDEIVGTLKEIPENKLQARELFFLGFSMIMTGDYKKGEELLNLSFQKKPLPETGKVLAEIYFSRKNYQKVIEINERLKETAPDEVKLLAVLSYRALGEKAKAEELAEKIENREMRLKAGTSATETTGFVTLKYDSNPLFIPEDELTESHSGWILNTGFKYAKLYQTLSGGIKSFISYQLNRNNKFLDFMFLSTYVKTDFNGKAATLEPYYIYTNNTSYLLGIKATLKPYHSLPASFTIGGEANLETAAKNALYGKLKIKIKNISTSILYKHFSQFPDKVSVKTGLSARKNINSFTITAEPCVYARFFSDGSKNIIPGCTISVQKNISASTKISTEVKYERGFGSGNLENDYSRYVLGISVSGSF